MSQSNPFAADGMMSALSGIGVSQILVQLFANQVTQQPKTQLLSVPSFPVDQQTASTAAIAVLNQGIPLLLNANADVLGFGNEFVEMAPKFTQYAQTLDDAKTSPADWSTAAAAMSTGVGLLISKATLGRRGADNGTADMTTLTSALQLASVALNGDMEVAQQVLAQGEITALRAQLATIQNAIDADNATLAQGATAGAIASAQVGLAVIKAYYSGVADGAKTLLGAIQGIVAADQKQHDAQTDITSQIAKYQAVYTQLKVDEVALAIVTSTVIGMKLLVSHNQEGALSLQTARDAWAALVTKMMNLQQALGGAPSSALGLTASLAAATTGWTTALTTAKRIQGLGSIPVKGGT